MGQLRANIAAALAEFDGAKIGKPHQKFAQRASDGAGFQLEKKEREPMDVFRHWEPELKFFATLAKLDADLAEQTARQVSCEKCGGRLHRADFPRAIRGISGAARKLFERRVSFCCSAAECRKRYTPPSLRFPARKWYAFALVLLAAALGPRNAEHVTGRVSVASSSVPLRTVRRWQVYFRGEFLASDCWSWLCARAVGLRSMTRGVPAVLFQLMQGERNQPNVAPWLGATLSLLVQAGYGCRSTKNEVPITIRRVWHCRASEFTR